MSIDPIDLSQYRDYCKNFERNLTEFENAILLFSHIDERNSLPKDQWDYLVNHFVPHLTERILRSLFSTETLAVKYIEYLQKVLDIAVVEVTKCSITYEGLLVSILDKESKFYSSRFGFKSDGPGDSEFAQAPESAYKTTNPAYYQVIDYWGKIKGFDLMINSLKDPNCPVALSSTFVIAIRNIRQFDYLNLKKFEEIMNVIMDQYIPNLRDLTSEQVKLAKKEDLEYLIKGLSDVSSKSLLDIEMTSEAVETLALDLSLKCFATGMLEKRLYSLSQICLLIAGLENRQATYPIWMTKKYLLDWIVANKMVENIFGESKHSQLIKNSQKIVEFLAGYDFLDVESLDLIWKCAVTGHDSLTKETFQILSNISYALSSELSLNIVEKIKQVPSKSLSINIIRFICDMIIKNKSQQTEYLTLLWDIIAGDYPSSLVSEAVSYIYPLVSSTVFMKYRGIFVRKTLDYISRKDAERKPIFFSLLKIILSTFPQNSLESETLSNFVDELDEALNLQDFFLTELSNFKQMSKEKIQNIPVSEETESYLDRVPFPHQHLYIEEIRTRLDVMFTVLASAGLDIKEESCATTLWNELYINAFCAKEKNECVRWFKAIKFKPHSKLSSFSVKVTPYIFEKHISTIPPEDMDSEFFTCFQQYFYEANSFLGIISMSDNSSNISIDVHPKDLLGEKEIWLIQLCCPSQEVSNLAMNLLNTIYKSVSSQAKNVESNTDLKKYFISRCLTHLSASSKALQSSEKTEQNASIINEYCLQTKRVLSILNKMIDTANADETQSTITRGRPLKLIIRLQYIVDQVAKEDVFSFHTHNQADSSTTYKLILEKCEEKLSIIGLELEGIKLLSQFPQEASCTLKEAGIVDGDEVVLQRVPYLLEKVSYFRSRKSEPKSEKSRIKKIMEALKFNEPLAAAALGKFKALDRCIGDLLDAETRKSFLQEFSHLNEKPLIIDPIGEIMKSRTYELFDTEPWELSDPSPLAILSSEEFSNILFDTLSTDEESVIEATWSILCRMQTPLQVKAQVLVHENPNWEALFGCVNVFKLLYTLKLIDQILFPYDESSFKDQVAKWKSWFLETGGLAALVRTIKRLQVSSKDTEFVSNTHVQSALTLLYKFVESFIHEDIAKNQLVSEDTTQLLCVRFEDGSSDLVYYLWNCLIATLPEITDASEPIPRFEELCLNTLLYYNDVEVRKVALDRLEHLSNQNKSIASYLFEILLRHKDNALTHYGFQSYQFFSLLRILLSILSKENDSSLEEKVLALHNDMVEAFLSSKIYEENSNSLIDWKFCGIMLLLTEIYTTCDKAIPTAQLLTYLFDKCLFSVDKVQDQRLPKCKTKTSRAHGFKLLILMAKRSAELYTALIRFIESYYFSYVKIPSMWSYHPDNDDKPPCGYVGLDNMGATCYMNSLLQQFYMMPNLRRDIFRIEPKDGEGSDLVRQLQILFANLQESERMSFSTSNFFDAYRHTVNDPISYNQQEDVNEFFNVLCHKIETACKGTPNEKIFHNHFIGKLSNVIRSEDPNFPYISEREEEFYTIPLDVAHHNNFASALDLFIQKEFLEGENQYQCDEFNTKINASKRCLLKVLPQTLVFHLMRFDYDVATNRKKKLNNYFQFPSLVNLKPWTKAGVEDEETKESYIYSLSGVLVHSGDAESGHYYSFIKQRNSANKWFKFNDRIVTEFNPEEIPRECFGGIATEQEFDPIAFKHVMKEVLLDKNAYMLIYNKVEATPQPEVATVEESYKDVFDSVWEDNATYLRTRYTFDNEHFEFLIRALINSPQSESLTIGQISTRFLLTSISHLKDHSVFVKWITYLMNYYKTKPSACLWLLEYLTNTRIVKELLLSCPHEDVRIAFGDFIVFLLKLFSENKITTDDGQFAEIVLMKHIYGMLEDSRSSWRRFKQYFDVIREYALIGIHQRKTLLEFGIMDDFKAYFTGSTHVHKNRASVMDESNLPDLRSFCDVLSIIIRGCQSDPTINPPNLIQGGVIEVSPNFLDSFLEKEFYQSFLQMDYNTNAVVEIITYISYKNPTISSYTMDVILDYFMTYITRMHAVEKIFESMILMEDDEEYTKLRIKNYISSSKRKGENKSNSLLRIAKMKTKPSSIILFILRLANKSKPVFNFLSESRDLFWILEELENILEAAHKDFSVDINSIDQDIKNEIHMKLFDFNEAIESHDWRESEEYYGFLYAHFIARQSPTQSYNEHLIMHQHRQIETINSELELLKNKKDDMLCTMEKLDHKNHLMTKLILAYNKHSKGEYPPHIVELLNDLGELDDIELSDNEDYLNDFEDEEDDHNGAEKHAALYQSDDDKEYFEKLDDEENGSIRIIQLGNHQVFDMIDLQMLEKLKNLKDMFPDLDERVLLLALRQNNFNVNFAVNDLFDEDTLERIKIHVERMDTK